MTYATENATENSHICGGCDRSSHTNGGLSQHQRTCQTRSSTRKDSRDDQAVLNVEVLSQNSIIKEDNLSIPCANTAKNTVISPNFLLWKFCKKEQFPHSFGRFACSPEAMQKLFLCTKFPHQEIR